MKEALTLAIDYGINVMKLKAIEDKYSNGALVDMMNQYIMMF